MTEERVETQVDFRKTEQAFKTLREKYVLHKSEPVNHRKARLRKLLKWVMDNRARIKKAVYEDFDKPAVEADISEVYPVIGEIKHALKHLDEWAQPSKVDATLNFLGTRSEIRYEPKGVCLIISPWNFPFNLCIGPLVSCLAAGNVALLKPSEVTPATSKLIVELATEVFDGEVIVLEGGKDLSTALLQLPFDHIFFTGSPEVGKIVMKAAAENLTSVTLELGGKSPAIIHNSARIKETAKRIVFGKFLNNGQTCIAPDYLLVHEDVKENLISELKSQLTKMFGENRDINESSGSYGRIVNKGHFARIKSLLDDAVDKGATFESSGKVNDKNNFFPPVILSNVSMNSRIMEEEIFGPILPVLTFKKDEQVIELITSKPKPLALYVFSKSKKFQELILSQTSAGTACINDCVLQYMHPNLPFGGVNNSGIGKSHGYFGFLAFSNQKPVLKQKRGFALAYFFHPPFSESMRRRLEPVIRWF